MPEVVMSHVVQSSAMRADITRHISELMESMDHVADGLDGFSDSSSDEEEDGDVAMPTEIANEIRKHQCNSGTLRQNGLVVRQSSANSENRSKTASEYSIDCFSNIREGDSNDNAKANSSIHKTNEPNKFSHTGSGLTSHDVHSMDTMDAIDNEIHGNTNACLQLTKEVLDVFDNIAIQSIRAAQDVREAEVPIMSPPPPGGHRFKSCSSANSSRYGRSISLNFLTKGEHTKCEFGAEKLKETNKSLVNISDRYKTSECICASSSAIDSVFGGWEVAPKFTKSKNSKKRKFSKQLNSDGAFDRLTGVAGSDRQFTLQFQHYRNTSKYMESYRLLHTVGDAGRTQMSSAPSFVKKAAEIDPYYSKMKNTLCAMATSCDLYTLWAAPKQRDSNSPVSSSDSAMERVRWDDEGCEDGAISLRPFTVRDRGKSLNLAPVRECTVPEMTFKEKQEQFQQNYVALNQYLNLMTPPLPAHGLQFEIDEAKMRRNGFRIVNTGENNLFPACTPRRGARPLRLGSAEFLKPGSGHSEQKWTMEKRTSTASVHSQSTVPGTIIVGSTVPPGALQARGKSGNGGSGGGKTSPYIQFQKDHLHLRQGDKPQTPPQHVAGKKFKPCERVTDLTSSARDKGRFLYTHGTVQEKPLLPYRSATMVDWDERSMRRERTAVKIDVNHLGIRGHTLKSDESLALYKHRRTATLKS